MGHQPGADYYVARIDEWMAEFDADAQHLRPLLTIACGDEAAAILSHARAGFLALIPGLPYIGGDENPLTFELVRAARCLALYQAMQAHGKTAAETGQVLYDATAVLIGAITPPQHPPSPDELTRRRAQRAARSQRRQYPADWVYTFVPGDGEAFDYGWDFAECAAQKLYHAHGADEFLPYYCFLDFAVSRAAGLGLDRTMTLAEGQAKCNHRYKRGRATEQGWPPPWLHNSQP